MRLLHTSDWQLGFQPAFLDEVKARALGDHRFETVRRIAQLAHDEAVDLVVVAGDVFDDNAVGRTALQQAEDALARFAPLPILLLPGNHDPVTADSALGRLSTLDHVHLAKVPEPLDLAGMRVFPCPLLTRHTRDDPAAWVPVRDDWSRPHVVLAHGTVREFGGSAPLPNRIHAQSVLDKGHDYLALGDWHGMQEVHPRAWYCGTPEPTHFSEVNPGQVLVVSFGPPRSDPQVSAHHVARTHWLHQHFVLDPLSGLAPLLAWLESLSDTSRTLLELTLEGQLALPDLARLERVVDDYTQRLLGLRVVRPSLSLAPDLDDDAVFAEDPLTRACAQHLRQMTDPAARDALLLLHRLWQQREEGTP
ncbi:MAG: metallophosphoesterase [Magnetococcus sp. WYHC-3]